MLAGLVGAGPASMPHGRRRQEDAASAVVLRSREGHGHLAVGGETRRDTSLINSLVMNLNRDT